MQIQITIEATNLVELEAKLKGLLAQTTPVYAETGPVPKVSKPEPQQTKSEPQQEQSSIFADAKPAPKAEVKTKPKAEPVPKKSDKNEAGPTKKDLEDLLRAVIAKKGAQTARTLMESTGFPNMIKLPVTQYAAFKETCEQALLS